MTTPWAELSELMVSKAGLVDPKKYADEKFELFSIPAFDRGISELVLGSEIGSSKQAVRPGDVMLSKIVPHIRRAWVVPASGNRRQIASGEWILFRSPRIYGPYLRHLLISDFFNRQFMQTVAGVGGSLLRARPTHVAKIRVPLPPLDEQRRIAAILDKVDKHRTKRRQALSQLDVLVQAIFEEVARSSSTRISIQEMIGSKLLLVHKDGNHGSNYPRSDEFVSAGVPFISAKNITDTGVLDMTDVPRLSEARARSLRHGWLEAGDVLLSHNASVGKVAVYRGNVSSALVGTSLTVFRPDPERVSSDFLVSAFRSRDFQAQLKANMAQTTRNQVPITAQRRLTVNVPGVRVQQAFAGQASAIDRIKTGHLAQLARFDLLVASLHHRAFRGEL